MKKKPGATLVAEITVLAAAYGVACVLGHYLATAPGYVTAIFPASGIALAILLLRGNRLWPGIFLGSLFGNIVLLFGLLPAPLSGGAPHMPQLATTVTAIVIAAGASLQALISAAAIKYYTRKPLALDDAGDIFRFFGLGGPLGCLIAPTVGILALHSADILPPNGALQGWWTWWAGDVFGVLIITPLIFIFMAPPRDVWSKRRATVALPVAIVFSVLLTLFIQIRGWEFENIQFNFHDKALQIAAALSESLKLPHETVASLERFFSSSSVVTPNEFRTFAAYALKTHPSTQALEWIAKVTDAQRAAFVRHQRQIGLSHFEISERDSSGHIVRARARPVYYPVAYAEPYIGNERTQGFDLGSAPDRLRALNRARDTGTLTASSRIQLVQKKAKTSGLLLLYPLYGAAAPPTSVEARRRALRGFVLGVFRIKDIFDAVLGSHDRRDMVLTVRDFSAPKDEELIYRTSGALPNPRAPETSWTIRVPLRVADRHWELSFTPTAGYLESHRSWQSWISLNGGLMFISLLLALLLVLTGRTARTERLVTKRTLDLSRSEERARAIFDTVPDGVIIIDDLGAIRSANPAALQSFGYKRGRLTGMKISALIPEITPITNVTQLTTTYGKSKACANKEAGGGYIGSLSEVFGRRRNGATFPIELSISEMNIKDERLFVGILRDISERKEVDRIKDEFISTISHELRTPLTSIKGSLGLLGGGAVKAPSQKAGELIKLALKNTERLIFLVNDILDMEKLASGKMTFDKQVFTFADLIRESIDENSGLGDTYGITYKAGAIAEELLVCADRSRLLQVIANLLSNAAKFSPPDSFVEIALTRLNAFARLSIADHGAGIPPDFQPLVFGRFSQADASDTRSGGGTGLGLHISRSIVEGHDGRISFVSPPGEGTTFFVDIPIFEARS